MCTLLVLLVLLLQFGDARANNAHHICKFGWNEELSFSFADDGSFSFDIASVTQGAPGQPFQSIPSLVGGDIRLFTNGRWYSRDKGTLAVMSDQVVISQGSDTLGNFKSISISWSLVGEDLKGVNSSAILITAARCYSDGGAGKIVFEQQYPYGLTDSIENRDIDQPASAFPSFVTSSWETEEARLVTFAGQNAAQSTRFGKWPEAYAGGYLGGPIALYSGTNLSRSYIAILSSLTHSMLQVHAFEKSTSQLVFGLQGLLHSVPAGFSTSVVISFGEKGSSISDAFLLWGDILLRQAGGQRTDPHKTPWISQLGYSTTGAYHYNPCDCPSNPSGESCSADSHPNPNPFLPANCSTYEDTLLAVHKDAIKRGLPYKWWLVDSFWHAYDSPPSSHFEDVRAQVGSIFPSSLHDLHRRTGMNVGAHWSSSFSQWSPYKSIDPENWVCGEPSAKVKGQVTGQRQCVPTTPNVFDKIFASDISFGLKTIKVDHMLNLLVGGASGALDCNSHHCLHEGEVTCSCDPGERNHTLSADALVSAMSSPLVIEGFINGLGTAASRNNVTVMWCMSFPNILMASVGYDSMTHAQGSDDSHPPKRPFWSQDVKGYSGNNWHGFGGESTLLWALGLWPFKDTFYSNGTVKVQNEHAEDFGWSEPMPFTHATVAALSGGGVAPGDPVGAADVDLIMMTCRADGLLLKPTTPAMYIDRVWLGDTAVGETSAATTKIHGWSWKFIVAIRNEETEMQPSDIGILKSSSVQQYVAYEFCGSRPLSRSGCPEVNGLPSVQFFSSESPFKLRSSNWNDDSGSEARLVVVAPVFHNGLALLGEENKLVPVSTDRFVSINATTVEGSQRLEVDVVGAENEVVSVLAAEILHPHSFGDNPLSNKAPHVSRVSCVVKKSGRTHMILFGAKHGEQLCTAV